MNRFSIESEGQLSHAEQPPRRQPATDCTLTVGLKTTQRAWHASKYVCRMYVSAGLMNTYISRVSSDKKTKCEVVYHQCAQVA